LLEVLLSERVLRAGDQGSHRGGVQLERRGDLVVAQAAAAQEQQLGLAAVERGEDTVHLLALLGGGVGLLGRWCVGWRIRQAFVAGASGFGPEVVERGTNGSAVEPAAGLGTVRTRRPPVFPEDFDGKLLGAGGIANEPSDETRDAGVVEVEDGFEVEGLRGGFHDGGRLRARVHTVATPAGRDL